MLLCKEYPKISGFVTFQKTVDFNPKATAACCKQESINNLLSEYNNKPIRVFFEMCWSILRQLFKVGWLS